MLVLNGDWGLIEVLRSLCILKPVRSPWLVSASSSGVSGSDYTQLVGGERRTLLGSRRKSYKATKRPKKAMPAKVILYSHQSLRWHRNHVPAKAFNNGGFIFSSIAMIIVSLLLCICFHLLVQCRNRYGGSGYRDIRREIIGLKWSLQSSLLNHHLRSWIRLHRHNFHGGEHVLLVRRRYSQRQRLSESRSNTTLIYNISKLGPTALLADICIIISPRSHIKHVSKHRALQLRTVYLNH